MKKKGLLSKLKPGKPKSDPVVEQYPEAMRGLFTLGRPKDGMSYDDWVEALRDYMPQLIDMALDDDLNGRAETDRAVWAPLHALKILSELAPADAVEPLLDVLDWDDEWIDEPLQAFYGKVGAPAVTPLKEWAMDPMRDLSSRARALDCLTAVADQHPDLRDEIVGFLSAFLDRPGNNEDEDEDFLTANTINHLLDLRAVEAVPEIRRAFEEDRVDPNWVSIEDVNREFGLALEDVAKTEDKTGLMLRLKCKACGRERNYTVETAYFDTGIAADPARRAKESPLIIPQRVSCPKCGAVDQYDLGALGEIDILSVALAQGRGAPNPMPGLQMLHFTTKRWGPVGPREALARYKAEVAAHPDSLDLRLGYGGTLRFLGYNDEARDQFEQALMIDPRSGEARFEIAQMTAQHGNIKEAIAQWERLEREFEHMSINREDREMRRQEVADTLRELRAGIRPEYHKEMLGNAGPSAPVAPPAPHNPPQFARPQQPVYGKVGRNEPCPCGSGKKYKQCHGRK